MSLRVWLPLNGDLLNKGLDKYTFTTLGTLSWVNGKTCALAMKAGNLTQTTNGISINNNFIDLLNGNYSVSVWIKPYGQHVHYNGSIFSSGNWNVTNKRWAFGVNQNNSKVDVLCMNFNTYIDCTIPENEWTNIICTRAEDDIVKLYKNGLYIGSKDCSSDPDFDSDASNSCIGRESYASGYFSFNGAIQDFRLYDHALSLKLIKEISKGLVLHYPLDDIYLLPTANLITTLDGLSNTCFNGAINKYGYGTSTDMYKVVTTFDGKKGTKVYMGTSGNNCYPYVYISNMYTSNGTNAPEYKTLSFDYYTTISTSISPYKLGSGNGTATYIVKNKNGIKTGTGTNSVVIPVISNAWNHIEITFHGTTNADAQWGYIQNQPTHISDTSNFWFFANMQLETKDHATPYAGVNGIRNENIIYDCSGYLNNGIVNDITYSIDTPKYSFSSLLNGISSYIERDSLTSLIQSASFWIYLNNLNNQIVFTEYQSGLAFGIYNNYIPVVCVRTDIGATTYLASLLTINKWYFITLVKDLENNQVLLYINGEKQNKHTISDRWSSSILNNFKIGARGNNTTFFNGKISDFRMYATALSENDIKLLYSIRASGDRDSNFYSSGKFIEEELKSITKQGITKSLLYEIGLPVRYIKDTITGSSANSYNHWCEIQIFNILDLNIALHKDVTFTKDSTSSTYSNSVVTDGTINSSYFPSGWGNTTSAIIDLGQTLNVTKIKIWHYYPDGRTYHNNITLVSIDGENWTTVYSTLISGEKALTVNGNEILLSPDKIFYTRDNYLYTNSFIEN